MSKYIHPATLEAAIAVASNLLPEDRMEVVEGHGHDPETALMLDQMHVMQCILKVPKW